MSDIEDLIAEVGCAAARVAEAMDVRDPDRDTWIARAARHGGPHVPTPHEDDVAVFVGAEREAALAIATDALLRAACAWCDSGTANYDGEAYLEQTTALASAFTGSTWAVSLDYALARTLLAAAEDAAAWAEDQIEEAERLDPEGRDDWYDTHRRRGALAGTVIDALRRQMPELVAPVWPPGSPVRS